MAPYNDATGERVLTTSDGTEYHLLFTLDALMAIETQTRMGPITILQRARGMELTITEMALLLGAGIEGAKRRHGGGRATAASTKTKELTRIIRDVGFLEVQTEIALGMLNSPELGLSDSTDDDEEADEAQSPKAGPTS